MSLPVPQRSITAIIGPSGCGKSTLLRAFNRMNEFLAEVRMEGEVRYRGAQPLRPGRRPGRGARPHRHGLPEAEPLPEEHLRERGLGAGDQRAGRAGASCRSWSRRSLRQANLWDEVKDRLDDSGLSLSGGQQQRLCIARALAMKPEIILMDEPASALDPISTARIEDLLFELKERYTIVIVTHNMQQAARVSDYTAFMDLGVMVEFGETDQVFTRPREKRTEDYVTGRFG